MTAASDDLPAAAVPVDQIDAWLGNEGAAFADVRRIGRGLAGGESTSLKTCEEWVGQLAAGPAPSDLVDLASSAPDPVLGDALAQVTLVLNRALSQCLAGEPLDTEVMDALVGGLGVVDEREAGR